jgi:novel protein kinase C epsilon type
LDQKILNDEVDFPTYVAGYRINCDTAFDEESSTATKVNGSVDTVRQHSFFKVIDWQALQEKRVKTPEKEKVAKKETREYNQSFSKVLKVGNSSGIINLNLFQGFSFINYGAKRG